jgi:hypothetical protein
LIFSKHQEIREEKLLNKKKLSEHKLNADGKKKNRTKREKKKAKLNVLFKFLNLE